MVYVHELTNEASHARLNISFMKNIVFFLTKELFNCLFFICTNLLSGYLPQMTKNLFSNNNRREMN